MTSPQEYKLDLLIRTILREQLHETLVVGTMAGSGDADKARKRAWYKLEDAADIIMAKVKREADVA